MLDKAWDGSSCRRCEDHGRHSTWRKPRPARRDQARLSCPQYSDDDKQPNFPSVPTTVQRPQSNIQHIHSSRWSWQGSKARNIGQAPAAAQYSFKSYRQHDQNQQWLDLHHQHPFRIGFLDRSIELANQIIQVAGHSQPVHWDIWRASLHRG